MHDINQIHIHNGAMELFALLTLTCWLVKFSAAWPWRHYRAVVRLKNGERCWDNRWNRRKCQLRWRDRHERMKDLIWILQADKKPRSLQSRESRSTLVLMTVVLIYMTLVMQQAPVDLFFHFQASHCDRDFHRHDTQTSIMMTQCLIYLFTLPITFDF